MRIRNKPLKSPARHTQTRQRAQFAEKLAQRKRMLAEKQNIQIEREAPEVAALSRKLREMEAAKEAELTRLALEHAAQLQRKEEAHSAHLRAKEAAAALELEAERKAQLKKWDDEERRRQTVRNPMRLCFCNES